MDALMRMMGEATRLEVAAKIPEASADKLRAIMLESAANLMALAEFAAPRWGTLSSVVRQLEKGK